MIDIPFPTAIDSTMRAAFSACPTKFFNSYLLKKTASSNKSVHLVFGGAYAAALEAMRQSYYGTESGNLNAAREAGAQALVRHWHNEGYDPNPEGTPKTLANCLRAFDSYLDFWRPADDHLAPLELSAGKFAIEFSFALPIPGIYHPETQEPLLYSGRFDMLAQGRKGALYVVDDKTAGQLGKTLTSSMRLKSQFTGYVWACQQFGYNVQHVIIRATQTLKTKIEHVELVEERPQYLIDRWLDQLRRDCTRMIFMWDNFTICDLPFDRSLDEACGSYGGCEFADACAAVNPQEYLETFYSHREWDPLSLTKVEAQ